MAQWRRERDREKSSALLAGLHALVASAVIFPALMIRYILLDPRALWGRAAVVPLIATAAIACVIFLLFVKVGWRTLRVATLIPGVVVVGIVLRLGAAPLNQALSARAIADELSHYGAGNLSVAVYLVPRETEFGLAFYRNQVVPRYDTGPVPDSEHLLVAAQGYSKGMPKAAGRKTVFLENLATQKLDLFYVPAK